jgi:hypothetical protein
MADLQKLVKSSVKKAFSAVGTLATVATFRLRSSSEFNFSEMTATVTDMPTLSVRALISKKEQVETKKGQPSNTMKMQIIMMSDGLPQLDSYDTVELNSVEWNIVKPFTDDGFITTLNLTRES